MQEGHYYSGNPGEGPIDIHRPETRRDGSRSLIRNGDSEVWRTDESFRDRRFKIVLLWGQEEEQGKEGALPRTNGTMTRFSRSNLTSSTKTFALTWRLGRGFTRTCKFLVKVLRTQWSLVIFVIFDGTNTELKKQLHSEPVNPSVSRRLNHNVIYFKNRHVSDVSVL